MVISTSAGLLGVAAKVRATLRPDSLCGFLSDRNICCRNISGEEGGGALLGLLDDGDGCC